MNRHLPLRIGIIGAARIAPTALVHPAKRLPEVTLVAVAARDPMRAKAFGEKYGIPRVHSTYEALLSDSEIDAIYNPLPVSLHCEWSIRALRAGKHVLCEKPMASNAEEAERMAQAAADTGLVLVEAFHYRYHPLAARLKEIVDSGELGTIRHIEAHLCVPFLRPGDIRYHYDLAGGATMDVGCYTINLVRFLAGAEPEVTHADARLASSQVDRWMAADFRFANGQTARITCSLFSAVLFRVWAEVQGDQGKMRVYNPYFPHLFHRLKTRSPQGTRVDHVHGETTYTHQLRAFVRAVRGEAPMPTDEADAISNMRVIDAVYKKAGLRKRGI